jgi:hypothetical protein
MGLGWVLPAVNVVDGDTIQHNKWGDMQYNITLEYIMAQLTTKGVFP